MTNAEPYATAKGVDNAIKEVARRTAHADPSLSMEQRIRLEYFNRFLSRVFSDGPNSEWLLKGGTGILARAPMGRATLDIDLHREGCGLDEALADLQRLAAVDLGDHFRFVYDRHEEVGGGDGQPYTKGYRVTFVTYIGAQERGRIKVDLVVGVGVTAEPTVIASATALDLPRLIRHEYRLYPVVDQIADKVCATMNSYGHGQSSSRVKDLVDLVVLAVTQTVNGSELLTAIEAEARRRRMSRIVRFVVPDGWGAGYNRLARQVAYCDGMEHIDAASSLVATLIDPALDGRAIGRTWCPDKRAWLG